MLCAADQTFSLASPLSSQIKQELLSVHSALEVRRVNDSSPGALNIAEFLKVFLSLNTDSPFLTQAEGHKQVF